MGENVTISILTNGTGGSILAVLGSFFLLTLTLCVGFICFNRSTLRDALITAFGIISFFSLLMAGQYVSKYHDNPAWERNKELAIKQAQPLREIYASHKFYLKESVTEIGIRGEFKGSVSGFLFVSGSIYGHIESGRVFTVVYKDDDTVIDKYTGVYRSLSVLLDKVIIETIPAGERPYILYPETRMDIFEPRPPKINIIPGPMHLYLPEGWKIL